MGTSGGVRSLLVARHRRGVAGRVTDSRAVEGLARAGLVARGVLHAVVGILALHVALGRQRQAPDNQGALAAVASQPLGKLLLAAVAVGFAGYALWRLLSAFLDVEGDGDDVTGWLKRAGDLARGLFYCGLVVLALRLLTGSSGDDQTKEADLTAKVLALSWGRVAVALVGFAVIGAGLYNGYRAVSGKYCEKLPTGAMSGTARRWVTCMGAVGLGARLVVFCLIGAFLVKAAVRYDPSQAVGVDGALARLAARPHGPWLLGIVAGGLFAYGLYLFVEARYRQVLDGR